MTDENPQDEKALHETYSDDGESRLRWLPDGIVSFEDYDTMKEAEQSAVKVKNDASLFKAMVDNILELEPSEEMDKSEMIVDLAQEFSQRVQEPPEVKEDGHFKEIYQDVTKTTEDDFGGGCPYCGFSTKDLLKETECPHCHNELTQFSGESLRDAVVNDNSMNIEEEAKYLVAHELNPED